jgi:hypothetical protein
MRSEQPHRQSNLLEAGREGGLLAAVKRRPVARVQLAAVALLLSGITAVGLVSPPAQAANLTNAATETAMATATAASATSASATSAAGYLGFFTGNGVRIWSRPGAGVVRGLGYRNQGFCTDSLRSGYYHGRNTKSGVVGWASAKYVDTHLLLEC